MGLKYQDVVGLFHFAKEVFIHVISDMIETFIERIKNRFTVEKTDSQCILYINDHLTRRFDFIRVQFYKPWIKRNRIFYIGRNVPEYPGMTIIYTVMIPFIFGFEYQRKYVLNGWLKKHKSLTPFTSKELSLSIDKHKLRISIPRSVDNFVFMFNWKETYEKFIRFTFHRVKNEVIEDPGWYSAIIPLEEKGTFSSEKLSLKVRKIVIRQTNYDYFIFKTVKEEVYYTFDIKDGIVVPGTNDVNDDELITGITFKGVDSHYDAIRSFVDKIYEQRKRRVKKQP